MAPLIDVVIRSYFRDFRWLRLALASLDAFACWQNLFYQGKPIHIYRQAGIRPAFDGWRTAVRNVLGINTEREFMVTMPALYPREIYSELLRFVSTRHGQELSDLALAQQPDQFSEFSVLGAYAFEYLHEQFAWIEAGDDTIHSIEAAGDLPSEIVVVDDGSSDRCRDKRVSSTTQFARRFFI